ncbi:MAG: Gfo/Idh/MocA family oxidoreductase [Planctomycetes bacterium]|nr:Gfo/Idh/MocA family oxidoreductase [Planctomycetota bacterium]
MKEIRVGMIGYAFMGKAHSNAYRQVARFMQPKAEPVMQVICGLDALAAAAAAKRFGWKESTASWKEVVERDDIDLVDISSPGHTHCPIAVAAAKAGKHLLCEKPLANNLKEAKAMLEAVNKARVRHMVGFNYRRVPAVSLAKDLIETGKLGRIYHFRATYLQDWIMNPEFPLVWRLQKKLAGSGAHGDLNAHLVDLARYLVGEIDRVSAMATTFIKDRPLADGEAAGGLQGKKGRKRGKVTVDDALLFLARFKNGALGSFEATRFAQGRKNHNRFEINGEKGSLAFNFERMNELEYFDATRPGKIQGWSTILATEANHPYIKAWWPPGHLIGYEHTFTHEVHDLLNSIATRKRALPDFNDGVKNQAVLEAANLSATKRREVKISELY